MASYTSAQEVFKIIALSLLVFFTFISNGCVLIVLLVRERRLLHKPFYMFICNICIADILSCVFSMTFEVSEEIKHEWLYGEATCKMVAFLEMSLFGVNIFTHLSIAIDRYINVVHPLKPPLKIKTAKKLLIVAWCYPTVMALPYIYKHRVHDQDGHAVCDATSISIVWLEKLYNSAELLTVFIIPLAGLTYMYIIIVKRLIRRKFQINDIGSSNRTTYNRAANYGTRISIAVVCVFVGCWVPFIVMYIVRLFTTTEQISRTDVLHITALYCSFGSELVSPVLYCAFDRNIRPALTRFFGLHRGRDRIRDETSGGFQGQTSRNETNENRTENQRNNGIDRA